MAGEEAEGTAKWHERLKGRKPVSYTHLDVYKRQAHVLPAARLSAQRLLC